VLPSQIGQLAVEYVLQYVRDVPCASTPATRCARIEIDGHAHGAPGVGRLTGTILFDLADGVTDDGTLHSVASLQLEGQPVEIDDTITIRRAR
jgi:hypothetical protein